MNWPYYPDEKCQLKNRKSYTFTWNLSDLKFWTTPIITSWSLSQNKAVLMMSLENFNCYYYKVKVFPKIKQFCWYDFKIWTAPIITSSNVHKNTPDLMKLLEYLNYSCYQEGTFFAKVRQFCWCGLKIWSAAIITSWNFHKR